MTGGSKSGCVTILPQDIGPQCFSKIVDINGKVLVPEMENFPEFVHELKDFIYVKDKGYIRYNGKRFYED